MAFGTKAYFISIFFNVKLEHFLNLGCTLVFRFSTPGRPVLELNNKNENSFNLITQRHNFLCENKRVAWFFSVRV